MKSILFFFATVTISIVSAKPLAKRDPTPPNGVLQTPNPLPPLEGSGLSSLATGKGPDITDNYTDETTKVNKYGACVALQEGDKIIDSAVFSTFVMCDIYNDTKCKGPKAFLSILLPPSVPLPNAFNAGSYFAKAYICKPFIQQPLPTDLQHNAEQIGLTGTKMR